ncbi:MAG: tetratricopeptide repeat protein [Proteobacteria bacterium]|nr:tetratricopeptide repeat protein [Pseudomonadota bacterium]
MTIGAVFAALALHTGAAKAQTAAPAPPSDPKREYDEAFQAMMKQPANLDVLFRFATIASQTGDLEGAVSALERMLLISPDLPRVRLELGVLYYRLGSFEVARTYLEGALASPNLPPEVRSRAEEFMAQVVAQQRPSQFSGEAFFGWRYQSNANLGPATSSVMLFGQAANLNQAAVGTADWGVVGSLQLRHTYDFGRQDRSMLETLFTAYANRQFQLSTANVSLVDLTTGPRFQIFNGIFEDVTLKPFAAIGAIWVNDTPYYASYGAGLEGNALLSDRLRNITTFTWRKEDYPNTWYLPNNNQLTGTLFTVNSSFQFQLTNIITIYSTGSVQRYETVQTPSQNYALVGVGGGMAFRFGDPLFRTGLPWSINLSVNEQWWTYDAPDPVVDPNTMRYQNDTILNIVLNVPFDALTTFSVSGGRFVRAATLPNYAFENNSFMFGISRRF